MILINWGLHYQKMAVYEADLKAAFKMLDEYAQKPGKAVIFQVEEQTAPFWKAASASV